MAPHALTHLGGVLIDEDCKEVFTELVVHRGC
jgi:hypothetical protein